MEKFKEWWESINQREQQLSMVSAAVIVIAVLYWGVLSPLIEQLNDNQKKLMGAQKTLSWVQENATILLQAGAGGKKLKGGNLTKTLNSSARQNNIDFARIANKKTGVEVSITEVDFDGFISWLTYLNNKHGVVVLNVDLTKTNRMGYIKVNRLLLANR